MKPKASQLLTVIVWCTSVVFGIGLLAAVIVAPEKVLYLVDIDRRVRYVPWFYLTIVRWLIGLVVLGLVLLTLLLARHWQRVSLVVESLYGNSADEFFSYLANDVRGWTAGSQFRAHLIALVALFGMGIVFRCFRMQLPVSYDESISLVWFSSRSWIDVISDYTIPNNHILYNLAANFLVKIFGVSPLAIRLPAFLAGVLVIPCVYWACRRLFNEKAALLAAGLAAASPLVVEYSAQGRGYTLFWLLFLVALILATYLKDQPNRFAWVVFVAVASLGMVTVPIMAFGLAVIGIWMLLASPQWRRGRLLVELAVAGIGIAVGTFLVYLPAILRTHVTTLTRGSVAEVLTYPQMFKNWVCDLSLPVVAVFAVGLAFVLFQTRPDKRQGLFLLLASVFAYLGFALVGLYPPIRVLNFQFFVFGAIASFGLALLYERIHLFKDTVATNVWAGFVIVFTVYWGSVGLIRTHAVVDASGVVWVDGKAPGAEGIACCVEGYFVDAKPIVTDWGSALEPGDAIVAHQFSGSVETMRFYLMEANRTPVLIHPYNPSRGIEQLAPYDQIYVLVKPLPETSVTMLAGSNPDEVADLLGVSLSDLLQSYYAPELAASYRVSKLYRLQRRVPLERDPSKPTEVPFNMFWYW